MQVTSKASFDPHPFNDQFVPIIFTFRHSDTTHHTCVYLFVRNYGKNYKIKL